MRQLNHIARPTRGQRLATHLASVVILAAVLAPGSATVFGQCQYEVTAIIQHECDDFSDSPTFGQGMNERGDVVGYYWPCTLGNERAFFWSEDTGFVTLPNPPGVTLAWAYDINDDRIIVGQHSISGIGRKGFVYDMNKNNGEYQYLEPLHDGATATNISSANAINNNGVVAGMRIIGKSGNNPHNAVIWRPFEKGAPVDDLGVMNGPNSRALALNSLIHATGWTGTLFSTEGWLLSEQGIVLLGFGPDGVVSAGNAVNEAGVVAGGIGHDQHGSTFSTPSLWVDGGWQVLQTLAYCNSSTALAINDIQQVVGLCVPSGQHRGFLWQSDQVVDLNELVDVTAVIGRANAISNAGQILTRLDNTKAALLTPVDVPFADLNYDCKVDVHDLQIMLVQWGSGARSTRSNRGGSLAPPTPDLNGDGVVDGTDLLLLLANWNP